MGGGGRDRREEQLAGGRDQGERRLAVAAQSAACCPLTQPARDRGNSNQGTRAYPLPFAHLATLKRPATHPTTSPSPFLLPSPLPIPIEMSGRQPARSPASVPAMPQAGTGFGAPARPLSSSFLQLTSSAPLYSPPQRHRPWR